MLSPEDEARFFKLPWQNGKTAEKQAAFGEALFHLFADPYAKVSEKIDHIATAQKLLHQLLPHTKQSTASLAALGLGVLAVYRHSDEDEVVSFNLHLLRQTGLFDNNRGIQVIVQVVDGYAHLLHWLYLNEAATALRHNLLAHRGAVATFAQLQAKTPLSL